MRLLTDPLSAAEQYVETARRTALAGVSGGLERRGGRLVGSTVHENPDGWWLTVRASVDTRPGVEIRYSRLLLHADGPDKDAETEGVIYGSGFVERLLTRAPGQEPVDGVIAL